MKNYTRSLASFALLATACHAAPFLAIDDNAEIFVTGTVGLRADSNVYLAADTGADLQDTILDFNPGLQLVFGKSSALQGSWTAVESFTRYSDHKDLDDELASTSFNANYDGGKVKATFNASYNELNQNTVDTRPASTALADGLIRRDIFAIGSKAEVSATEKSSVSVGVQFNRSEFVRAGFSDSQVMTLPVNYYYELTPKVDLSVGYRYRQRWETIGLDAKDHFVNVGARGEFTPKLSGEVALGLTQRNFRKPRAALAKPEDRSLFGVDASLAYAASPKTSFQFGVSNDFDTNSQGQQQKNFSSRLAAITKLSEDWSVTASVSYRAINYFSRIDDYFEGQIGATYTISEKVNITGAFAYRSNESDLVSSNFDQNVFSVAANFRF